MAVTSLQATHQHYLTPPLLATTPNISRAIISDLTNLSLVLIVIAAAHWRLLLQRLAFSTNAAIDETIILHCCVILTIYYHADSGDGANIIVSWLNSTGAQWYSLLLHIWTSLLQHATSAFGLCRKTWTACRAWWKVSRKRFLTGTTTSIVACHKRMTLRLPHLWLIAFLLLLQICTRQIDIVSDLAHGIARQRTRATNTLDLSPLIATRPNASCQNDFHCPIECP